MMKLVSLKRLGDPCHVFDYRLDRGHDFATGATLAVSEHTALDLLGDDPSGWARADDDEAEPATQPHAMPLIERGDDNVR